MVNVSGVLYHVEWMRSYHGITQDLDDLMAWPHSREVILYARLIYYTNKLFIIYLLSDSILIYEIVLVLNPVELQEHLS